MVTCVNRQPKFCKTKIGLRNFFFGAMSVCWGLTQVKAYSDYFGTHFVPFYKTLMKNSRLGIDAG